jgi:hypothetical protein
MASLYDKLQRKAQARLLILDLPPELDAALAAPDGSTVAHTLRKDSTHDFALAFVRTLADVERRAAELAAAVPGDGLVWFAYPKASSKRHRCEFNRDTGWAALGELGYEPVRQVALDEDWSALRFRRVEHIGVMTRHPDGALTAAGRAKATAGRAAGARTARTRG